MEVKALRVYVYEENSNTVKQHSLQACEGS